MDRTAEYMELSDKVLRTIRGDERMDVPELFRQSLLVAEDELRDAAIEYTSSPADHSDRETEEALDGLLIAAIQYTAIARFVREGRD